MSSKNRFEMFRSYNYKSLEASKANKMLQIQPIREQTLSYDIMERKDFNKNILEELSGRIKSREANKFS